MASRTRPMSNWPPMVDLTPISTLSKSMKTAMRLRTASVGITKRSLVGARSTSRQPRGKRVLPAYMRGSGDGPAFSTARARAAVTQDYTLALQPGGDIDVFECGQPGQRGKVAVTVNDGEVVAAGAGGDQAIHARSDGDAGPARATI